ncbi:NAD(P)/FAD-dependent oxidoreductase [Polymorphum gilvum]|uniref:Pyridine nucleotide-disulfide oxidoreductase family protein n=1 Tax=Polymorphum gilvum (strain LMG 25793 / CGMCC 1.9160 / SL003B-26A1) TaxID=991905 RepID=F2IXH7_POLGS|nr:FAD-dependent oxidoreductase [Polymorphum gilvum]ADZ71600.1 pyridine nucleotide-disulfide oxidoreductase family protein [Polymorphum gilvum SL003B-26A1]
MAVEDRVVIAGAGHAGFQTAACLRQSGYAGEIVLIGDEPGLPYNRPPLSKGYLANGVEEGSLCFRPPAFFEQNRIDLVASDRVVEIDRSARAVRLASGRRLTYGHLVLATGARNRSLDVPGTDLDGVCHLRTVAEARAIRSQLGGAGRVVVVGAGFIGLEFAATAALAGAKVTVIDIAPRALSRAVSAECAGLIEAYHRSLGIEFVFGAGVSRLNGTAGRVTDVDLPETLRIPADLVLIGVGVVPNSELATAAGLEADNGIVVDALLRTGDPAISAVGDCAAAPNPFAPGPRIRLESVQNANDQARLVAARLAGKPHGPYAALPWFWSDQGKVKLQIAGLGQDDDERIVIGDPDRLTFSVLRYREGRLACVESVGRAGDHMAARRLIAQGAGPRPDQARNGLASLKDWLDAA